MKIKITQKRAINKPFLVWAKNEGHRILKKLENSRNYVYSYSSQTNLTTIFNRSTGTYGVACCNEGEDRYNIYIGLVIAYYRMEGWELPDYYWNVNSLTECGSFKRIKSEEVDVNWVEVLNDDVIFLTPSYDYPYQIIYADSDEILIRDFETLEISSIGFEELGHFYVDCFPY